MIPAKKVKPVDLRWLHAPITAQLDRAALRVLREQWYIQGPDAGEFEQAVSVTLDGAPGCGVSCAAFELWVALKALVESSVNYRPRTRGPSKYSVYNWFWRGLKDCFGIRWLRAPVVCGNCLLGIDAKSRNG